MILRQNPIYGKPFVICCGSEFDDVNNRNIYLWA